jgi:Glycosyltransferase 61
MIQPPLKTKSETIKTLPSKRYSVGPLKIFTYPTRLADAWQAKTLEINIPAYSIDRPEIAIASFDGSTRDLNIQPNNPLKRLYKKWAIAIEMEGEYIFDARYDVDGNLAHILKNLAPCLLAIQDRCPKITVILRANATTRGQNTYKLLGYPVLCTNREVNGKVVTAPTGEDGKYEGWYDSLFGDFAFAGYNPQTPEKVFISRRGTRGLANESEVEQLLQKYGFQTIYYEDIPIPEQWSIARNAKAIVGVHGAALASIVFNRKAVKLIELFHPGYVTTLYRRMTYAIGGTWCAVTGQYPGNIIEELDYKQKPRRFALSPMRIDLASLRMALDYMNVA